MTEKEMKKLSRADLLEMLIDQSTELALLRTKLSVTECALQQKELKINEAGSIAEASLQLSGIFEAAEKACQQYTENIRQLSERQEAICAQREEESREAAELRLAETEKKCLEMESQTRAKCDEMLAQAKEESQKCWEVIARKLEAYCAQHGGLGELLELLCPKQE